MLMIYLILLFSFQLFQCNSLKHLFEPLQTESLAILFQIPLKIRLKKFCQVLSVCRFHSKSCSMKLDFAFIQCFQQPTGSSYRRCVLLIRVPLSSITDDLEYEYDVKDRYSSSCSCSLCLPFLLLVNL